VTLGSFEIPSIGNPIRILVLAVSRSVTGSPADCRCEKCLKTKEHDLTQDPELSGLRDYASGVTSQRTTVAPVPQSLGEIGLDPALVEQLILKYLYFRGDLLGRAVANLMGLQFSLIEEVLERLKYQHLLAVKKSQGVGSISALFTLTESGRNLTREYLENNQYAGPAPVPIDQYSRVVRLQKLPANWLTLELLDHALRHLVVEDDIRAQLGPAVSASESFLIYGQPGNGKTALAEALFRLETEPVLTPYALEYQGNIIQIYDPIYHPKIDDSNSLVTALASNPPHDGRWFKSKRPFIITGGELTLSMLDLSFNQHSKVYDAPFQLKANNGIYLIDDFGRQKATPTEILNRWIVPLERHVDYLNFRTGGKITVPFETFVIFSTNLQPESLGDEAFLRRIQFKMFLRSPELREFLQIFRQTCDTRQIVCPPGLIEQFVEKRYKGSTRRFRRCHPRDIMNHVIHIINFERRPKELTEELLDRAFRSCFVESVDVES
jgi:predicted ATPase with chaperone activity